MSENKYDDEMESDSDDEYDRNSKNKKWKLSANSHKGTKQHSSVDYKINLLKKVNRSRVDDAIQQCIGQILLSFGEKDADGTEIRKAGTGTVYKRLYDQYVLVITCCHNMVKWNDDLDRKQIATNLWYLPKGIEDDSVRLKCIKWIGNENYKPRIDHCPNDIGIILCRDTNNYYGNVLQKDINEIIRVGKSQRNKLVGCGIYGYPGDANGALMGMMGKAERKDNEWKYVNINTYPGQSGAAVYKEDDDEMYGIYGVHTFGDVEKQINRAVKINDDHIKWIQMVEDQMKQKADEYKKMKQKGKKTKKNKQGDDVNEVKAFLQSIGLSHCCWSFEEQGCSQMANLKFVNNVTLNEVFGIHKYSERKMILNGIKKYFSASSSSKKHEKNQKNDNKKITKNDIQNTDVNSNDIAQCAQCQNFGNGKVDASDHQFYCMNCWGNWEETFEAEKQNDDNKTNENDEQKKNDQQKHVSDSKTLSVDAATEVEEKKENDQQKIPKASAGFKVHAAMDFGTDGVGLAYTINDDDDNDDETKNNDNHLPKIINHSKYVSTKHKDVLKQKAIILLDENLNFIEFGKEAKRLYMRLRTQKHKYYLFERFKMSLYEQHVSSNPTNRKIQISNILTAANGKRVTADIVFVAAFKHLKSEAITFLKKLVTINDHEIQWVITVPAIWNDEAKYKMKCWAMEAGLIDGYIIDQCVIRYEPDCASLSLQYEMYGQTADTMKELKQQFTHLTNENINKFLDQTKFEKDDKYILVDAGGGTVDIARHEVVDEFSVKEIGHPSGGPWGSTYIDQEYKKVLNVIFDESLMNLFQENSPNAYVEMIDNFQKSKERFYEDEDEDDDEDTFHDVALPNEFMQFLEEKNFLSATFSKFKTMHSNKTSFVGNKIFVGNMSPMMMDPMKKSKEKRKSKTSKQDDEKKNMPLHYQYNLQHRDMIKLEDDNLRINTKIWESMFDHVIDPIIYHTKKLLINQNFKYFCLVGGFSCSKYFQYRMKEEFGRLKFIVPENPNLAVVQGAAYFGKRKNYIKARVLKYTYGCICRMLESTAIANGVPEEHIMKYRKLDKLSGQYYVKNCINVIARKNESIKMGQVKRHETARKGFKANSAKIRIFVSDMEYPTVLSHGREQNSLKIKFDKNDKSLNVDVEFYFFDTTIRVYAYKENTPSEKEEIQITYEQEIDTGNFDQDFDNDLDLDI